MKRRSLLLTGAAAVCAPTFASAPRVVAVGVLPGPHAEIMAVVREVAATRGLALRLVEREGGRAVNNDVASGRLDAACFQDAVAFAAEPRRKPSPLIEVAATVTLPVAIYSRRVASVRQLPRGATIAIPRERAAASRALVLLHNHGLVELRDGSGLSATPRDVTGNRYGFRLVPLPQDQLAGALYRLDAAVIDRPHAVRASLMPARDSIGLEDARTPWAGVLAVRDGDRNTDWVRSLVASYRSEPVKRYILAQYQDSVRRPW
jgi:D-methionine transport system substrate-binding protein